MNKLKLNPFWAGMAVATVGVVALFAWIYTNKIQPQAGIRTDLNKAARNLETKAQTARGQKDIAAWADYRSKQIDNYESITRFYADQDKGLDRWFPGLGEPPPRGLFDSKFKDEATALEATLKKDLPAVKFGMGEEEPFKHGFNWEKLDLAQWGAVAGVGPDNELRVMRELQKRFWVRQHMANVILQSRAKVSRVDDFRFFARLDGRIPTPVWENPPSGADNIDYLGVGAQPGAGAPRAFTEWELPHDLGRTMTFGFAVELPYSDVPKILQGLVAPGTQTQQRLLINLIGAQVTIRNQNEPSRKIEVWKGDDAGRKAQIDKIMENVKAHDVLLSVTGQAIDFDPTKVKNFKAPPQVPENAN